MKTKGFTLLEVLVVLSLGAIITMSTMNVFKIMFQSNSIEMSDTKVISDTELINGLLTDISKESVTIEHTSIADTPIKKINKRDAIYIKTTGGNYLNIYYKGDTLCMETNLPKTRKIKLQGVDGVHIKKVDKVIVKQDKTSLLNINPHQELYEFIFSFKKNIEHSLDKTDNFRFLILFDKVGE